MTEWFRFCTECGADYPTPDALLAAHNQILKEVCDRYGDVFVAETDASEVWICPECTHDF